MRAKQVIPFDIVYCTIKHFSIATKTEFFHQYILAGTDKCPTCVSVRGNIAVAINLCTRHTRYVARRGSNIRPVDWQTQVLLPELGRPVVPS